MNLSSEKMWYNVRADVTFYNRLINAVSCWIIYECGGIFLNMQIGFGMRFVAEAWEREIKAESVSVTPDAWKLGTLAGPVCVQYCVSRSQNCF